jgi:hypothetical protein
MNWLSGIPSLVPNIALNLARFAGWTLRGFAAQRRLARALGYAAMSNTKAPQSKSERWCYCGSLDYSYLEENKIPVGYCGICSSCGKPGHLRHAPGCAPYTDAWCDSCFKRIWFRNNLQCLSLLATPAFLLFGHWFIAIGTFIICAATTYAVKKSGRKSSA